MKKIVSVLLAISLLVISSIAYAADLSSMTEVELKEQLDAIRNELAVRGLIAEKKTVIFEKNDIQIYINGDITMDKKYDWDEHFYLFVPVVVVNNTKQNINFVQNNASVNGWTVEADDDFSSIPAGKKAKGNFIFDLEDSDMESISDFTDVEFYIKAFDDNTYKDLFEYTMITVLANQSNGD